MNEKDRAALEDIRRRSDERRDSGVIGGVREWFDIIRLLEIIDKKEEGLGDWDFDRTCSFCTHINTNRKRIEENGGRISVVNSFGETHLQVRYPNG